LSSPKLLYIDIENFPIVAAVWELWEATAVWVESDTFISSVAYKFEGEKTKVIALPDYHGYRKYKDTDDRPLLKDLHKILSTPNIVIAAHNGDAFDLKRINARFAVHRLPPIPPAPTIDTLKIARRHFKFDSNKLDNLGRYLGEGRKIATTGGKLIRECRDGNRKAWGKYRRYNARDVDLLARVHNRLKPFAKTHPSLSTTGCPTCKSKKTQRRGEIITLSGKATGRFRYQCRDSECGRWFSR